MLSTHMQSPYCVIVLAWLNDSVQARCCNKEAYVTPCLHDVNRLYVQRSPAGRGLLSIADTVQREFNSLGYYLKPLLHLISGLQGRFVS